MEDHTAQINGITLHYRTVGKGEVLFLVSPGWGVGSVYLQRAFSFLAARCKLVFIDTRGSGLSGRPADARQMSTITMADDLEALRIHLEVAQISLFGHSNSGAIILRYAARYPGRVKRLVLVGSQLLGMSAASDTQRILSERSRDPQFAGAVRVVQTFFAGQENPASSDERLEAFVQQVLPLYLYNPEKYLALAQEQLSGPISSYAFNAQYAADRASSVDQTQSLSTITAKVIIMAGRHDFICPVSVSERLHAGIRDRRIVIFEASGHFPWLEEPGLFTEELERFLFN
ncbi:pimeloyl-ACP methyl ester carboxylesterase [Granulicella aggregans]|uniref:Pimeloyl-ACP methyl ester carboxylesterase n=1 Tax=Granulicella aggregans TaxID=474949 RepID=A0A7W7ZJJ5_9BACT|nr:alpha/beta hydrolase [Granulicella aggregans]MBB5061104.1 pimeloyl-ACP methyl ester carboxylesterase [Granulicella aggregans]